MSIFQISTKRLRLVLQTRQEMLDFLEEMTPEDRAMVSAVWLAQFHKSGQTNPWIHGFRVELRDTGIAIGSGSFKGPPDEAGMVEIAYGINPEYEGNSYATEVAEASVKYAINTGQVKLVRAHTMSSHNASTRVLVQCGFRQIGEVMDPEDGPVWRWEIEL